MELRAIFGCLVAFAACAALTPLAARLAFAIGAVDQPSARGLADKVTPRLGGLAMLAGLLIAGLLVLPDTTEYRGLLAGGAVIVIVGAIDDVVDLPPELKLLGQFAAGTVAVLAGVRVEDVTLPFLGRIEFEALGGPLTLLGLVAVMNVVNLSDGIDGLAAGVCAISAAAFAVIAADLGRADATVLAAVTAGVAAGFLVHNFHPASIFMGDAGSNLLGYLLGCVAVQGTLKTNALVALVLPLCVLAVPFLDTGFVVAKRLKYRRPVYAADTEHFHHRFARIGFSQRRTVLYLYAWTLAMAGLAVALRFIPYSESSGRLNAGWALVLAGCFGLALAASFYLVVVLEILKIKRFMRAGDPDTTEHELEQRIERELTTGEFDAQRP